MEKVTREGPTRTVLSMKFTPDPRVSVGVGVGVGVGSGEVASVIAPGIATELSMNWVLPTELSPTMPILSDTLGGGDGCACGDSIATWAPTSPSGSALVRLPSER